MSVRKIPLSEALIEISSGVGEKWADYRVLGATRAGLALAKEPVGKAPGRYKLVEPGTIFYNPMRINIGSIAMVDEGEEPGITSPDYVVFRTRPGVLHPRWFYHWLRSKYGDYLIRSLARGAVRERLLFKRLVPGVVTIPDWATQTAVAQKFAIISAAEAAARESADAAQELPAAYLRAFFESECSRSWPTRQLRQVSAIIAGITLGRNLTGKQTVVRPYLRVANVKDGHIDLQDVIETPVTLQEAAKLALQDGDLLLTEGGDRDKLGRGAVWRQRIPDCVHQNHVFRVRVDRAVADPDFVSFQIGSSYGKAYFLRHAKQTTGIASINQRVLGSFPLMLPVVAEQKRIAAVLLTQIERQQQVVETIRSQAAAITSIVTALLRNGSVD